MKRLALAVLVFVACSDSTEGGPPKEPADSNPADGALDGLPGDPVKVTTALAKSPVQVFEATVVTCKVLDAKGLEVAHGTSVGAEGGVDVQDHTVSAAAPGAYKVACAADGLPDLEVEPAVLTVTGGDPAKVVLSAKPDLDVYEVDTNVTLSWVVTDVHGNVLDGVPATLSAPEDGVKLLDADVHKYRLQEEGAFPFVVTLDAPHELITDTRVVIVDATGPVVTVEWPARGQQIQGDGDFLFVTGTVVDAFGQIAWLEVNDQKVEVEADGSFEAIVLPHWGTNVLFVLAEDGFGNLTKLTPTFQYSAAFTSFVGESAQGVKEDDGLELLVGQDFLDDGVHDPAHVDDLATILEVLLGGLDIPGLVGSLGGLTTEIPIYQQSIDVLNLGLVVIEVDGKAVLGVEILEPTDIGPTGVAIDSRLGGVDSSITFGAEGEPGLQLAVAIHVDIPISLSWDFFGQTGGLGLYGKTTIYSALTADLIQMLSKIDMSKVAGGDLQVVVQKVDVTLEGMEWDPIEDVEIAFGTVDFPGIGTQEITFALSDLFDITQLNTLLLDPLTTQILPLLVDLLEPLVATFADDVLKTLLLALEIDTSIELPSLLGPKPEPAMMDVYTNLTSVQFTDDGGQMGLSLGLYTDQGVEPASEPLGAIQRMGCMKGQEAAFEYGWDRSAGLAVKTDAINAGFYALWWSGFLNGPIDLGGLLGGGGGGIPLEDIQLDLEFLSPPLLSDCGAKGVLEAEVGDLYVELSADVLGFPITADLYVDASIALFFGGGPDGLTVTVGEFKFLDAEVLYVDEVLGDLIDLKELLETGLADLLGGFVVGQSFGPIALPPIALGDLVPGLPPEAVLQLTNLGVTKSQGYVVVGGDLE